MDSPPISTIWRAAIRRNSSTRRRAERPHDAERPAFSGIIRRGLDLPQTATPARLLASNIPICAATSIGKAGRGRFMREVTMVATTQSDKHRFHFPTAFTILFGLIIVVAVLTWIIPAGQYDTVYSERSEEHTSEL